MRIIDCRIIIAALLLLCFGMGARAGNIVSLTGGNAAPGQEVTVSVSMTNTDAVSALQLSIPLGDDLTFVEASETPTARLSGLDLAAGVKNGELNIMVYSVPMTPISGSAGELLTFRLKVGDTPTDISLVPSVLKLTDANGTTLTGTCQEGTVSIRCAKAQYSAMNVDFGSVPIRSTYHKTVTVNNVGNEPLTVTSLVFSDATTFSSTTQLPFEVAAGGHAQIDVTYAPMVRGTVNETMKVECNSISKLNTIQLQAQPFAVNELHVGNASGISDEEVTISLTVNNMDDLIGFQIEFQLPDALEYVDGSFELNADRRVDHNALTSLNGNLLRIIGYSDSGKAFTGDDGVIGTFRVKLVGRNSVTLKASKAMLTAIIGGESTNVASADYGGHVTIQSPRLSASSSLAFGDVPVTSDIEKAFTIRNNGAAPMTVSRIVFNNEHFSVKESLPLVIAAGQSTTVTVCNDDKTEGDFSATMNIYSNDPDQRLWTVDVTGRIFAPNYLIVTADDAVGNGNVTLHVGLNNYDTVEGIQFDITSNEDYTISDENIIKTTRGNGLTITVQKVNSTTLRVVAYVMGTGIAPGEGELMTLKLTPAVVLTEGGHQVTVSNVKIGTGGLENKTSGTADQTITFNVQNVMLGDVNGNGNVDIFDVVLAVDYCIGKNPTNFNKTAADINNDGVVDIFDIVLLVNIAIGKN